MHIPARVHSGLPFAVGESLSYRVRIPGYGTIGRGSMSVAGPELVRGAETYVLRSEFQVRLAWVRGFDRSQSWLDPVRMATLRFEKTEQHPFARGTERVDVFPEQWSWSGDDGRRGVTLSDAPLDELAFIYYVRTIPLATDSVYGVIRHYDAARNPVQVRVLGRETLITDAGEFRTIVVEMRVKDPRRMKDAGAVIKIHFTDDHCRLPVRIESVMPFIGTVVSTLESYRRR